MCALNGVSSLLNYRKAGWLRFIARHRALGTETAGAIDEHGFVDGEPDLIPHVSGDDVPRGAPYWLRGWAIDLGRLRIPWELLVELDGRNVAARVQSDVKRPDVARLFDSGDVLYSGFRALVDTRALPVGPHELRMRAVVGRYGTAFAYIPRTVQFYILHQFGLAFAPASNPRSPSGVFELDPMSAVDAGSVLALSGLALDSRSRPLASVAAQIDDSAWNEGWTGMSRTDMSAQISGHASPGRFCIRIRLDTVAAGFYDLRFAGKTHDGQWVELGQPRRLTVSSAPASASRWPKALVDSGEARIEGADGGRSTHLAVYRLRTAISLRGKLTRSSPIGLPVELVARTSDGFEYALLAWSAPSDDSKCIIFGAEIAERELPPGTYRVFVDAPDRSWRFTGRADTGCDLTVARRPPLAREALWAAERPQS